MQKLSLTKKYQTYPKYKDSGIEWVGDVPEGWDMATSRRLFQTKKQLASETESQTVLSLTLQGVIPRVLDGSGKNPANYDTYQEFQKDDLVFCLFDYDVTPRTIGYVGENGMMTGAYTRLIPKSETSSKFFYYYFLYLDYTKELLHLCTGLRNSISKPVFWSLKNPLPPKEEQEKIARFLDEQTARIDETIAKKERLIELLKEKRTATINHAVTKGLDPHAELIDSGIDWIDKIPKGWKVKKLKHVTEVDKESLPSDTSPDFEFEYYDISSVNFGVLEKPTERVSFEKAPSRARRVVSNDDVVIATVRPYLRAVAHFKDINEKKIVSTGFSTLTAEKNNLIPRFLFYYLFSDKFIHEVVVRSVGVSYPAISPNKLASLHICLPNIDEQEKIANFLDSHWETLKKSIEKVECSIGKLKELKSSLISHAVTGKIKV